MVAVDGILNMLYQLGGRYVILFPVLYWSKSVQQTTGTLAFLIGCYSVKNNGQVFTEIICYSILGVFIKYFKCHFRLTGL